MAAVFFERVAPWLLAIAALALLARVLENAAGQRGGATPLLALLGNTKAARALAFVFGLSGVFYGLRERALRRAELDRLARRTEVP